MNACYREYALQYIHSLWNHNYKDMFSKHITLKKLGSLQMLSQTLFKIAMQFASYYKRSYYRKKITFCNCLCTDTL